MPTNLYGPGDNYHPENSHVIPGLMRRFHEAKMNGDSTVIVWGTGNVRREFLFVDDLAGAVFFVMGVSKQEFNTAMIPTCSNLNVGSGFDLTIAELAQAIKTVTSFKGEIQFDESMPDGTPQKLMDCSRLNNLGWRSSISLANGLVEAYSSFLETGA